MHQRNGGNQCFLDAANKISATISTFHDTALIVQIAFPTRGYYSTFLSAQANAGKAAEVALWHQVTVLPDNMGWWNTTICKPSAGNFC